MRCRDLRPLLICCVAVVGVLLVFAGNASAIPVGTLAIDSGSGQVTVTLASIDWAPAGGGTGTFLVGGTTNLTSSSGNPAIGSTGVLRDLTGPPPVLNFMTFPALPGLALPVNRWSWVGKYDLCGVGCRRHLFHLCGIASAPDVRWHQYKRRTGGYGCCSRLNGKL